jgi:hypothetical protein
MGKRRRCCCEEDGIEGEQTTKFEARLGMRVLKLLVQRSRPPSRKQGRRQAENQVVPADRASR